MWMKQHHVFAILTLMACTIYDIWMICYYWFPAGSMYHFMTFCFLFPVMITIVALALRSIRYFMWSLLSIWGGTLDILWFFLQFKPLPKEWPWLWNGVSLGTVLTVTILGLLVAVSLEALYETHLKTKGGEI